MRPGEEATREIGVTVGTPLRADSRHPATGWVLALVAALLLPVLLLQPSPSDAAPVVDFAPRRTFNDNGAIALFGNNLMTCPTSDNRCASARAGTSNLNNNGFRMVNLDADGLAGTVNSSGSDVSIPQAGTVLWAGLYWGARLSAGAGGTASPGNARQMSLRLPGETVYRTIDSDVRFGPTPGDGAYQELAEVTSLVQQGGSGRYWGANVVGGTGEDRYAGWSLVIVYRDPTLPLRNLTVFDGFTDVGRDNPEEIEISGFKTPLTGPVETELGLIAYEGDFGTSGDQATLDNTLLSTTPLSRSNNLFNGTNDDNGTSVPGRLPADLNMLGYTGRTWESRRSATTSSRLGRPDQYRGPLLPGGRHDGDQALRPGLLHEHQDGQQPRRTHPGGGR